jgi:TPR repeat protein
VSREELEAASFNADGEARLILARAYEEGHGGPVDMHLAAEMYWRMLNLGPEKDRDEALRRVINLHADGRVAFRESSVYSPKNPDEFARLVQAYSRRITSTESLWQVGDMFERGYQLPESKVRAVEWLTRAAKAGSAHAMNRIGELWAAGLDGASDSAEAIRWFEKAAKRGLGKAQLNLGLAYQRGEGVTSDAIEAAAWLRLAADQNLSEARRALTGLQNALTTEQIESAGRRSRELADSIRADRSNQ